MSSHTTLLAAVVTIVTSGPLIAQVTFRGFGYPTAYITGISADRTIIVGQMIGLPLTDGFRWTAAGGLERIGGTGAYGISRDGRTIVGSVRDQNLREIAAIWQGGTTWRQLGGVPGGRPDPIKGILSTANSVSADGSVIVGLAYDENLRAVGFRWTEATGMVNLGPSGKGDQQTALAVSANGSVIVGRDKDSRNLVTPGGFRGYVHYDGELHLLHAFGWAGAALRTNHDGSIIVGEGPPINASAAHGGTMYRYTAWDGRFYDLGAVWPGIPLNNVEEYQSRPYGLSDDGSIVAGETGGVNTTYAMIWTEESGAVYLHEYLTSKGVTAHQGWYLQAVYYVSPDGKVLAGYGTNPRNVPESWIVTLP